MEELEINFLILIRELSRRWTIILVTVIVAGGCGYVVTKFIPKKFLARITFVPDKGSSNDQSPTGLSLLTGKFGLSGDESPPYLSHFEEFLKSRNFTGTLMSKVAVDSLGQALQKSVDSMVLESESSFNSWVSSSVTGKKKDGMFILEAISHDPTISLQLVLETFQTFEERLQKARKEVIEEDLDFVADLVAKNQVELRRKSDGLRLFLEQNRGASSPQLQQLQQGFMLDLKLVEEKYILSVKEHELLKIKKEKRNGRSVLIETPYLNPNPVFPSPTKFSLIGSFVGLIISTIMVATLSRKRWITRTAQLS